MVPGRLWSALFFLMLITLGLGSQLVGVQGLIAAVQDILPDKCKMLKKNEILRGSFVFLIVNLCRFQWA